MGTGKRVAVRANPALFCLGLGVAAQSFVRPLSLPLLGKELTLADVAFLVCGSVWLASLMRGKVTLRVGKFWWPFGACVLSVLVSVVTSTNVQRSAILCVQRLYSMALAPLAYVVVTSLSDLRRVVRSWLIGAGLMVGLMLLGILLFFIGVRDRVHNPMLWNMGSLPDVGLPRIVALMLNANAACNLLVVSMALLGAWLADQGVRPWQWLAAAVVCSFAALFTMSPGLGGLALVVAGWFWVLAAREPRLGRLRWPVALLGAAAALLMLAVTAIDMPRSTWSSLTPSVRLLTWKSSLQTFLAFPLAGKGVGLPVADVQYLTPTGSQQDLGSAHNLWLSVAGQQGSLGLVTLVALVIYLTRRSWAAVSRANADPALRYYGLGLFFALVFAHGYTSLSMGSENQRHLWLIVGLLAALAEGLDNGAESWSPAVGRASVPGSLTAGAHARAKVVRAP